MASKDQSDLPLTPGAAILAWLWPGAGHISLGQTRRGILIMAGVLFLFLGGVLIGGVDVVDRKEDRLWFVAQIFCGPIALATDYVNQSVIKPLDNPSDPPNERQGLKTKSLGRVNEIGTLYCALAGLMNFVVILDALQYRPKYPSKPDTDQRRRSDDS